MNFYSVVCVPRKKLIYGLRRYCSNKRPKSKWVIEKTERERECEVGAFVILIRAPCRHIIDGHQCGDMSENRRAGRRCLNLNGQINCVCQACGQVLVPLEPRQQQQTQAAGQRINWFLDTG